MLNAAPDSLLLFGVGMLNILFAIILAGVRARSENRTVPDSLPKELGIAGG